MRAKIAELRGWFTELSTERKISLIALTNGGVILIAAVLAISAVAVNHLMYLWNLIVG
jgi:hypothetical protein